LAAVKLFALFYAMYMLLKKIWIAALIAVPVVLWILPAGSFDHTGVELCPSKFLFKVECFGCGMTRAVMHLHHFDWQEAVYYNYLVLVVYPILVFFWCRFMLQAIRGLSSAKI
jgi:hypothetical protein